MAVQKYGAYDLLKVFVLVDNHLWTRLEELLGNLVVHLTPVRPVERGTCGDQFESHILIAD